MTMKRFIENIKNNPESIDFKELMDLIDSNYSFKETAFTNGDLINEAGQNSGSCKLFAFAKLHGLSKEQTLVCFGSYYRDDVLKDLKGDNHQNIRNFMKSGWDGIKFEGEPLK